MEPEITESLKEEWRQLLLRCVALASGVHVVARDDVLEVVRQCRMSNEIQVFSSTLAEAWPRYHYAPKNNHVGEVIKEIYQSACSNEIINFLIRTDLLHRIVMDGAIPGDPIEYLKEFKAQAERNKKVSTQLVLIDGLATSAAKIPLEPNVQLRVFSEAELKSFFEVNASAYLGSSNEPDIKRLSQLSYLERTSEEPVGPPDAMEWDFRSAERRVYDAAQPWVSYLNLSNEFTVRPIQLYTKTDFLLESPIYSKLELASPSFKYQVEEDDYYEVPDERVLVSGAFAPFAQQLEAGRKAAIQLEHRADTALRFFAKSYNDYDDRVYPMDEDELENVIVSAVIALESIFLDASEHDKTEKFVKRGAALLSSSDSDVRSQKQRLSHFYRLRSLIVHGGQRLKKEELESGARWVQEDIRSALRGFLRLSGKQSDLIAAPADATIRARNRPLTALP
jgi:hypothetical protein